MYFNEYAMAGRNASRIDCVWHCMAKQSYCRIGDEYSCLVLCDRPQSLSLSWSHRDGPWLCWVYEMGGNNGATSDNTHIYDLS